MHGSTAPGWMDGWMLLRTGRTLLLMQSWWPLARLRREQWQQPLSRRRSSSCPMALPVMEELSCLTHGLRVVVDNVQLELYGSIGEGSFGTVYRGGSDGVWA